jgi:hypothetical protein
MPSPLEMQGDAICSKEFPPHCVCECFCVILCPNVTTFLLLCINNCYCLKMLSNNQRIQSIWPPLLELRCRKCLFVPCSLFNASTTDKNSLTAHHGYLDPSFHSLFPYPRRARCRETSTKRKMDRRQNRKNRRGPRCRPSSGGN